MSESNQKTTVEIIPVEGTGIEHYGDMPLITELTNRLMYMHPDAKELGRSVMLAVAQLAFMTGANPLPGTNGIHVWKDNKGKIQITFGIGYWRNQTEMMGGVSWAIRPRPMTEDERDLYNIQGDDVAAICAGALWSNVMATRQRYKQYEEPCTIAQAREENMVIGIGIAGTNTYSYSKNGQQAVKFTEQKEGRPLIWTALKRCETDLLKKLASAMGSQQHGMEVAELRVGDKPGWYHDFVPRDDQPVTPSLTSLNNLLGFDSDEEPVEMEYEEVEATA